MHGLPSPSEMAGRDDLLSGDLVTVQAQFSYAGDSQAEMRLAVWDEDRQVWLVGVPDQYLTRHRDVHVYVFCYYGADETGERAETAYEATFRPISRPAPDNVVTEDQIEQWENLKAEIEISLSKVDNAVDGANAAAVLLNEAGEAAEEKGMLADDASKAVREAQKMLTDAGNAVGDLRGMTVKLDAGKEATASILWSSSKRLMIGAPAGADGNKGETGDTGPADVKIEFDAGTGTLTITTAEAEEGSE